MTYDHNSEAKGCQLPSNQVMSEFGEVNVWRNMSKANSEERECRVELTIAMEPQGKFAEGWRTGLALDASASMKRAYGRKVEARVDPELLTEYIKQGRLRSYLEDGEPIRKIEREAFAEIQKQGYEINFTENILQPLVQDFMAYLSGSLDGTGKTSLIYWGCGDGEEVQILGEFDQASCQQLAIAGPPTCKLGKTTKLLPAIAHFTDQSTARQYTDSQRGMYIFLTDGRIDDLEQVKNYTKELALEIAVGKRNYLKLILIGVGNEVDRHQLQELDDFDTGLDLDLWDYKIASEMTSLSQIFAEVINENLIIAEHGYIYDDLGNCVRSYAKGLPAKVDFVMRDDSQWFELEVGNQRIRQVVILDMAKAIAPFPKKQLMDFEIKAQQPKQPFIDDQRQQIKAVNLSGFWKILEGTLIGILLIGVAFGFWIRRSDDQKLQNQPANKLPVKLPISSNSSIKPTTNLGIASKKTNSTDSKPTKPTVNVANPNISNKSNSSNQSNEMVVFFASDESQLINNQESKIDGFWSKIQNRRGVIQVTGHTDKMGDYAYNLELAQARANEVVRLLSDRGLDNNYEVIFGVSSEPLRKDATAADNASSRRVVVQFKEK